MDYISTPAYTRGEHTWCFLPLSTKLHLTFICRHVIANNIYCSVIVYKESISNLSFRVIYHLCFPLIPLVMRFLNLHPYTRYTFHVFPRNFRLSNLLTAVPLWKSYSFFQLVLRIPNITRCTTCSSILPIRAMCSTTA